jgi:multidrug efflux pump subunit AcrB
VQANPLALASRGIGLEDLHTALNNATLDEPKGNLENEHQQVTIDTNDQLFDAQSFRNVIVAYRNGAPVKVSDVAQVIDSSQLPRTGAWFNGKQGELLLIRRQAGANTLAVVDQIKSMMPTLLASFPPSVHVELVSDRSENIRASVQDVEFTLLITIGLVVVVVFLFLRSFWATVIPSVVVPLSLVGTFGVMYAIGYSLDNLSLMGLTIAVGFLVDDAIVMIENIVRYLEMGERPFEAALKGAGQIGFTIISITFSLVAVFIPLIFMAGIVGRLFREFALTVTTAVLVSGFISLTLTPVMCSLFLTRESQHGRGRFNRGAEAFWTWILRSYDRGLGWVFRHQLSMLVATLALIVATGALYVYIPKGFFPEQDTGFIFGQAEARQDISFAAMTEIENEFTEVVLTDPAVSAVVGFAGATGGNASENTARMFIQLKPPSERGVSAQQVIAPATQGGPGPGRKILHAGRAGCNGRRPPHPDGIPIYAHRHGFRGAQPLGADRPAADAESPGTAGRRLRPTDRFSACGGGDRPQCRVAPRPVTVADRPDALRCFRAAADRHDLYFGPAIQADPRGGAAVPE